MASTLSSLGTDYVNANIKGFLDMFGVANHVHNRDTSSVKPVDDFFGGDTDSRDEEPCFLLNNDVYEFRELTFGVIELSITES